MKVPLRFDHLVHLLIIRKVTVKRSVLESALDDHEWYHHGIMLSFTMTSIIPSEGLKNPKTG